MPCQVYFKEDTILVTLFCIFHGLPQHDNVVKNISSFYKTFLIVAYLVLHVVPKPESNCLCKDIIGTIQQSDGSPIGNNVPIFFFVNQLYYSLVDGPRKSLKFHHFVLNLQKGPQDDIFKYYEKLDWKTIFSRRFSRFQEVNGFGEFLYRELLVKSLSLLGQDNFCMHWCTIFEDLF